MDGPRKRRRIASISTRRNFQNLSVNSYFHADMVVTGILSRLPVKTLMRFKCVSKAWKESIEQDSDLIKLHRTHALARTPLLLTMVKNWYGNGKCNVAFYSARLECGEGGGGVTGATLQTTTRVELPTDALVEIVGPINGLVCLFNCTTFSEMVYNLSTRQATPWITSEIWSTRKNSQRICQFGFDPDKGHHKVIVVVFGSSPCCEVLTVGVDSTGRKIADLPPIFDFTYSCRSTYANGSIYYLIRRLQPIHLATENTLVIFKVGAETFRMLKIPQFLIHSMTQLDWCLALVLKGGTGKLKLLKFQDHTEEWTTLTIVMPAYIPPEVIVHTIPGNDHLILEPDEPFGLPPCFYCYNRITKTFSMFEMQGIPPLRDDSLNSCGILVEDLSNFSKKTHECDSCKYTYSPNEARKLDISDGEYLCSRCWGKVRI